jgi:hypothetical protein
MRLFGWSKVFEERRTYPDIPARVRKTEVGYWVWLLICIAVELIGLAIMLTAPADSLRGLLLGLFIAVNGVVAWAVVKIVVHTRLAMYWIIWDSQNRAREGRPC